MKSHHFTSHEWQIALTQLFCIAQISIDCVCVGAGADWADGPPPASACHNRHRRPHQSFISRSKRREEDKEEGRARSSYSHSIALSAARVGIRFGREGGGGAQMPWGLKPYKWPLQVSNKLESSSFFDIAFLFFVHFTFSAHTRFFHCYFHFH